MRLAFAATAAWDVNATNPAMSEIARIDLMDRFMFASPFTVKRIFQKNKSDENSFAASLSGAVAPLLP